jgi:micrococcal nuclease
MRPDFRYGVFLLLLLFFGWQAHAFKSPVTQAAPLAPTHVESAYVSAVVDGDTLYVELDGLRTRVRLAEVDAPEKGQPFGRRSEQSLRELIWKRQVRVAWSELDRYGRPIVRVTTSDGIDVNAEQVRRGFAWVYRQYAKDQSLYSLEAAARTAQIGLWADSAPQPPWEWRKEHRVPSP